MTHILSIDLGTKNFSYCLLRVNDQKIIKWSVVEISNSMSETHEKTATKLATKLNELDLLNKNDFPIGSELIIVIELQPKCNIKTLILSGNTSMYFVLRKMNKSSNDIVIQKIISYHAKNKLKFYERREGDEPMDTDHLKAGYYKNKVLSKEHAKRVLRHKNEIEWISSFEESKKKDDLADSYLMGLSYIKFVINGLENPERMFRNTDDSTDSVVKKPRIKKVPKKVPKKDVSLKKEPEKKISKKDSEKKISKKDSLKKDVIKTKKTKKTKPIIIKEILNNISDDDE